MYALGEWEIDLARRELRARGVAVRISGRAFDILEVLVQSDGELVTKDNLSDRVWPGMIVEENTLQVQISAIRKALGPDREMLKTASGRGYRLLGAWTCRQEDTSSADSSELEPMPSPAELFQTNLPAATSELVGRANAVQHLRGLLSAYRVVTLTGSGGIGKTKLALEVARSLFPAFHGDRWLVDLVSLSDPGLVPSMVAGVLGLKLGGDEISAEAVARAIGARQPDVWLVVQPAGGRSFDHCLHSLETRKRANPSMPSRRRLPHLQTVRAPGSGMTNSLAQPSSCSQRAPILVSR